MAYLRLVQQIVDGGDRAKSSNSSSEGSYSLLAEAKSIENFYGKNLYSDFLIKHNCRPDPSQAKVIACLMGVYLRDNLGEFQPDLPQANRHLKQRSLAEKRLKAQCWEALSLVEEFSHYSHLDPANFLKHAARHSNAKTVRASLQAALDWLARIDSELQASENEIIGAA